MGLFDRWREKGKPSSPDAENFEALIAEMTRGGIVIVTRDNGTYTVYWARKNEPPMMLGTSVDALKRSAEGQGATAFKAILDCKVRAERRRSSAEGRIDVVVAKTTVKTTTTTQTETRTEVPEGTTVKVEVQPSGQPIEQPPPAEQPGGADPNGR
jgi:hypothetical protein